MVELKAVMSDYWLAEWMVVTMAVMMAVTMVAMLDDKSAATMVAVSVASWVVGKEHLKAVLKALK